MSKWGLLETVMEILYNSIGESNSPTENKKRREARKRGSYRKNWREAGEISSSNCRVCSAWGNDRRCNISRSNWWGEMNGRTTSTATDGKKMNGAEKHGCQGTNGANKQEAGNTMKKGKVGKQPKWTWGKYERQRPKMNGNNAPSLN